MTPAYDIRTIYRRALWRVRRLDSAYRIWQPITSRERTLVVGGLVVELDNVLIQSMRLYIQCIVKSAIRSKTIMISGVSHQMSDAEFTRLVIQFLEPDKLRSLVKKRRNISRRDEKTIRNPADWVAFLTLIGAPVPPNFKNAIGLNLRFYDEIGVVRNFYAHRNKETLERIALKFPQLAYGTARHPDELVTSTPIGITRAKYPQWSSEGKQFLLVASGAP